MKRPNLTTLWMLVLAAVAGLTPVQAQTPQDKAVIAYLQKLQQADGGFLPVLVNPTAAKPALSSLRATSSAIRALKYFGGELPNKEKVISFVDAAFDKASGGFVDTAGGKPDVATTAVGLMAVAELKMPPEKYTEPAVKFLIDNAKTFEEVRIAAAGLEVAMKRPRVADDWVAMVLKTRNPDGTWGQGDGQARDTAGTAAIVLRLGSKLDQAEEVLKALKAGQRKDGGFGKADAVNSDLETTYRVMRAFHMLKAKPADLAAVKTFVAKCRNGDGGYGVAPGEASSGAGTYFASIILYWLGA